MLYIINNLRLSISDTIKNILKSLISSFGIIFLISFLVLYLSFRDSLQKYIDTKLFGKISINEILIKPYSKGKLLSLANSSITGKYIPAWKVRKIKKMDDLKNVFSIMRLNFPSKVAVEMLGKKKRMYTPICGIHRSFFKGKIRNWKQFYYKNTVPVIAPAIILQIANNFMSIKGYPIINEKFLKDFPIRLDIYTTPAFVEPRVDQKIPAKILGFTDAIDFPGILVPSNFIYSFSKKYKKQAKRKNGFNYIMIYAKVKDIKKLPEISNKIKKLGLKIESRKDIASKTNRVLEILDASSLVIIAILLILSIISIFNSNLTIVYNRSQKFSLKRILGISKLRIMISFMFEAIAIGALYGIIGFYLGNYLISYFSGNIEQLLPILKDISLESKSDDLFIKALGLSVIVSVLSAFIPALFASNVNLFKAVRKSS